MHWYHIRIIPYLICTCEAIFFVQAWFHIFDFFNFRSLHSIRNVAIPREIDLKKSKYLEGENIYIGSWQNLLCPEKN